MRIVVSFRKRDSIVVYQKMVGAFKPALQAMSNRQQDESTQNQTERARECSNWLRSG
jgi:hypothetical protein